MELCSGEIPSMDKQLEIKAFYPQKYEGNAFYEQIIYISDIIDKWWLDNFSRSAQSELVEASIDGSGSTKHLLGVVSTSEKTHISCVYFLMFPMFGHTGHTHHEPLQNTHIPHIPAEELLHFWVENHPRVLWSSWSSRRRAIWTFRALWSSWKTAPWTACGSGFHAGLVVDVNSLLIETYKHIGWWSKWTFSYIIIYKYKYIYVNKIYEVYKVYKVYQEYKVYQVCKVYQSYKAYTILFRCLKTPIDESIFFKGVETTHQRMDLMAIEATNWQVSPSNFGIQWVLRSKHRDMI